jgi:hypothetical protein
MEMGGMACSAENDDVLIFIQQLAGDRPVIIGQFVKAM